MTNRRFVISRGLLSLILWALIGFPIVAQAAESQMWSYLSQHGYGPMPVDAEENREVIQAEINGTMTQLMVDTGCARTCLTQYWARRLHLDVHPTTEVSWGLGGNVQGHAGVALVNSFKLNNYEINRTRTIQVLSGGAPLAREGRVEGLFGFDFLSLNAVILPVGARMLLYKPGNGPIVSIEHYMGLLGLKPVPLHYVQGGLRVQGEINGQPFDAVVDCGAQYSTFDLSYIRKIPGADVSSSLMTMAGVDGTDTPAFVFTPNSLALGPLSIATTEFAAVKAPAFAKNGFDALLGFDLLAAHHAILDFGHNTLWMK